MNLRTIALILVLLALAGQSAGVKPVQLGRGLSDQVINLSSVTKLSSQNYNFSSAGYVSPRRPQTMALSTSSMINQAKIILQEAKTARDEAVAARDEAKTLRNETMSIYSDTKKVLNEINKSKALISEVNESRELLAKMDEKELSIQSMQKKIESEAEASAANAAKASAFLNSTSETYQEILRLSSEIEDNVDRIRSTIEGARNFANSSVINTIQSLGDVLPIKRMN